MMVKLNKGYDPSEVSDALHQFVMRCIDKPELVGITVISNRSANCNRLSDEYSDVDIEIFITLPVLADVVASSAREFYDLAQDALPEWLPEFDFIAPVCGGIEMNIRQRILEYEERENYFWSESRREAYSSGFELLYDPQKRVHPLIQKQVCWRPGERNALIAMNLSRAVWDMDAARTQALRNDYVTAHRLLNHSIDSLLKGVCYLSNKFAPVQKWMWDVILVSEILNAKEIESLQSAMCVYEFSSKSIESRIDSFSALLLRVYKKAALEIGCDPGDYYNSRVSTERQLRHLSIGDWSFDSSERGEACWNLMGRPTT